MVGVMSVHDQTATAEPSAAAAATSTVTRSELGRYSDLRLGIVLTLVLVACLILAQAIDFWVFQLRIGFLNSDTHASIFGFASLAAQGLAAFAAAVRSRASRRPRGWMALSTLTALLLVVRIGVSFRAALLLGPVTVLFVLAWYLTSDDPAPGRAVVRAGLAALIFSYAVHIVGPHVVAALGDGRNTWPYEVKGMLKHSAELAGWMLVALGISRVRAPGPSPPAPPRRPSE
jgi:hypothetical protein